MKRWLSITSLRFRSVAAISVLIIMTSAILVGYLINNQKENMTHELEKRGSSLVKMLANNCEYGVMIESEYVLFDLMKTLSLEKEFVLVTIYSPHGNILAQISTIDDIFVVDSNIENNVNKIMQSKDVISSRKHLQEVELDVIEFTYPVFKYTVKGGVSREELGVVMPSLSDGSFEAEPIGLARLCISLEEVNKDKSDMVWMTIFLTSLVVFAAIILTITMVNFIIKPIENIVNVTERVASGDLTHQVPVKSSDELARLAISFNKMTDSLRQSRDDVEMYNRTLEQKIAERTHDLEEAQQQLIQSEKMAAIGQLAAGVAHELNNPMGGILGYSQYALEKLSSKSATNLTDEDISSHCRFLADIEQQARRCKTIVKNLLKFSRTSSTTEFDLFDLNQSLEDTFTFVKHQLDMKNIILVKNLDPNIPPYNGNSSQLQQVFTNLMLNAQQAMGEGGELRIESRFSPPIGEFQGCVEIEFADTGTGIPPEILTKIFEPFYTTKDVGQGTGLGLSISYGIVQEHQGDILVKSKEGEGTAFTLVLPLDNTESEAKVEETKANSPQLNPNEPQC
jgi:two-component system, NtrC family, sensor kinase